MTAAWTAAAIAAMAALVSAGACVVLLQRLRGVLERQEKLEHTMGTVCNAVCAVEARLRGVPAADPPSLEPAQGDARSEAEGEEVRGESIDAEIAPEIQAAIAAAAIAAAGENARVSSMRLAKTQEKGSAWSQQGRVLVQTSHNMRPPR